MLGKNWIQMAQKGLSKLFRVATEQSAPPASPYDEMKSLIPTLAYCIRHDGRFPHNTQSDMTKIPTVLKWINSVYDSPETTTDTRTEMLTFLGAVLAIEPKHTETIIGIVGKALDDPYVHNRDTAKQFYRTAEIQLRTMRAAKAEAETHKLIEYLKNGRPKTAP